MNGDWCFRCFQSMILSILKSLFLGIWLGALIMLGYAVAGPLFQHLPSKTLAGSVNAIILGRMNSIEWVCSIGALLMSTTQLVRNGRKSGKRLRIAELAMLLMTLMLLWTYSSRITARMETLRTTIGDFDHPQQSIQYVEAKTEFDKLHHTYTALVSANMMLVLAAFVLSNVMITRDAAYRATLTS